MALLLAYPLAYLLAFKVKRHRNLMYMAVIIPLWVSYLVRAYAWKIILGQEGILNGFLHVGSSDRPAGHLLLYSKWAVIIALIHIYTPFTLMPIYAVLESIPPALKEASQDLYASRWQTFRHVVLPLSLPGVVAGCTFSFVLSMGDFIAPGLLGGNDSALMVSNLVVSLFGVALQLAARRRGLGGDAGADLHPALAGEQDRDRDELHRRTGDGPGSRSRRGGPTGEVRSSELPRAPSSADRSVRLTV